MQFPRDYATLPYILLKGGGACYDHMSTSTTILTTLGTYSTTIEFRVRPSSFSIAMDHSTRTLAELRQLVFGDNPLTREEHRYMKTLLSCVHVDLIGELPLELVAFVAMHLELKDFVCCLRVSKTWRKLFLSDPVMTPYARQMWPALTNGEVNQCNFLATLSKVGWASYCFRGHAKQSHSEIVRWDARSHYKLDSEFHSRNDNLPHDYTEYYGPRPSPVYAFGKVAWSPYSYFMVVDDLRLKTRKVFTPPSGTMRGSSLELQALGSRLVVGTIDRLLIAWDHVENRPYERLLPCRSLRCTTHDDKVAIVLFGGDVVMWTPGREILQLNTSHLISKESIDFFATRTWKSCMNVFFDSCNNETLYLASGYFSSNPLNNMVHLTVHEILATGDIASFSAVYQHPDKTYNRPLNSAGLASQLIVTSKYEFDHNCIFFGQRGQSRSSPTRPIAGFDTIKREFIHFNPQGSSDQWRLQDGAYPFSTGSEFYTPYNLGELGGIDMDFMVEFKDSECYEVIRSHLIQEHTQDSNVQETG
ncbi:hypothetical protein GGS21DRAFT_530971 [Xylaria nigripes]|nr:hypothetical protein GGS21DRAFT_530971 [Xylaria nigripes]